MVDELTTLVSNLFESMPSLFLTVVGFRCVTSDAMMKQRVVFNFAASPPYVHVPTWARNGRKLQ